MTDCLFVAHPGHELRVFGWVRRHRPYTTVLTDGSGSLATSRIASSRALLEREGAALNPSSGLHTDRDLYRRILNRDEAFFRSWRNQVEAALDTHRPDLVVGDAEEGYNSVHDLFRHVVNAAVRRTRQRSSPRLRKLVFKTVGRPDTPPAGAAAQAVQLHLNASELDDKIKAAIGFAGLEEETRQTLAKIPREVFALECLFPEDLDEAASCAESSDKPHYETYGEQQIAKGLYSDVIRLREHILPLKRALFDA